MLLAITSEADPSEEELHEAIMVALEKGFVIPHSSEGDAGHVFMNTMATFPTFGVNQMDEPLSDVLGRWMIIFQRAIVSTLKGLFVEDISKSDNADIFHVKVHIGGLISELAQPEFDDRMSHVVFDPEDHSLLLEVHFDEQENGD